MMPDLPSRLSEVNWDDLKYFLAVVRTGSSRRAASSLNTNHATVSRRLSALETAIDARLFDRSQQGLVLTQLGETLLPFAESVEVEMAAAARKITGQDSRPVGEIRISIPNFLTETPVTDILAKFCKAHPEIELIIQMTNQLASIERHEVDMSLRYARTVDGDVVGRKLIDCTKSVFCSPDYAASMKDDGGEGLQYIGWFEPIREDTADWVRESPYPKAKLRHRATEGALQLAFARKGLGLIQVPCFFGDSMEGLVRAPFQQPVVDRSLWLLYHHDLRHTARIRLLIDFVVREIEQNAGLYNTLRRG
ncbi:MAG: LysR family transcriptional regulator [Roseibium sp.]|uniref:LysR family transcriptional regulator n=1 Tax=Roseibium sp. TaxID=1936156 RepID=UPI001B05995D|nr:LysR family transcriptional regulator [Roseibium sp.]MBO6892793.1 LysR family transcriptional regulator [Roseibium sp.]MBO6928488.1 LysR family transcriptional regulator [Roseibium sp.]